MTYRFDFNMTTVSSFSNNKSHNEMINQTVHVPDGCLVLQFTDFVPWNNPDNLMSQESVDAYEKFVHGVCLPILFLVSIVTNPLNMAVAYKHGLGERINLCIFALAFLDMTFFITAFSIYADKLYRMIVGSIGRYGQTTLFFAKNHLLGLVGIKFASDFLTTIIACERCLCVMSPLRSKTIMKTKTLAAIILVVCPIILGGFLTVCLRWTAACIYDIATNTTTSTLYPSQFYINNRKLVDLLDSVVYGFALSIISVTTVATTTVVTVVRLFKMAAWRAQTSSAASLSPGEIGLTRMLVGTSVLFVVCSLPLLLKRFVQLAIPEASLGGRFRNLYDLLTFNELLFSYINSSFNFFVYVALGSRFRETLKEIFRSRFRGVKHNQSLRR